MGRLPPRVVAMHAAAAEWEQEHGPSTALELAWLAKKELGYFLILARPLPPSHLDCQLRC